MLNIPQQYQVNRRIGLKTILSGEMKPAEKKRLKSSLKSVHLTHQISGEAIPSWVDASHRCEVIMFLDVELDTLKSVEAIAAVLQRLIKPPCVIRFHDTRQESFSFAHKRLSSNDADGIVLVETVITPPQAIPSGNKSVTTPPQAVPSGNMPESLLTRNLDFQALQNSANKKDLYIEAMTKAFIASHPALFSRVTEFLDASIWYDSGEVLALLGDLKALQDLNQQKKTAVQMKDKVAVNGKMKKIISEIMTKLES